MKRIFIDIDVNGSPFRIAVMDGLIIYDLNVREYADMKISEATKKIKNDDPCLESKHIIRSLFDKED